MDFKEIYTQVVKINQADPASHEARLGKITEEVGELATAINRTTGRKFRKFSDTDEVIALEALHEGADVIQNVMSLLAGFNFTAEQILEALTEKNVIWEKLVFVKEVQKKVNSVYSENSTFSGSGIGKEKNEFTIICYWNGGIENTHLVMPSCWDGIPLEHISIKNN